MSEVVAAMATVHSPFITGMPEAAPPELKKKVYDGFETLRRHLEAAKPDAIVIISSEHVVNLTPSNAAPFMIGIGRRYPSREEPFNLGTPDVPGAAELGYGLAEFALQRDFDTAHSVELIIDHGTLLPLHFITPQFNVPIVVILVNTQFPPMAKLSRCYQLGQMVGEFLGEWAGPGRRLALLATGGLSHHVGQREHGQTHEAFDRMFMGHLLNRDDAALASITQEEMDACGNGTNEIRNWVTLLGAVPGRKARAVTQEWFIPGWATGGFQVVWENTTDQPRGREVGGNPIDSFITDVTRRGMRAAYEADREGFLRRYSLTAEERDAVLKPDFCALYDMGVHPMLLLYYSRLLGMTMADYLAQIQPRAGRSS